MSLQSKLYTLNALSTELGYDRRSLGKWLDTLPPAETEPDGARRWRMRDVLDHIAAREKRSAAPAEQQTAQDEIHEWIAHQLVPAIFGSKTFVSTFTGALRTEMGMSKVDALRAYMYMLIALTAEIEHAGVSIGIELPPL